MKVSRRQLIQIISEAMKVPVFDKVTPEEIEALRTQAEKLRGLESDPDMRDTVTSMYRAFGSEEPGMTQSQEDAFFAGQEQYEINLLKDNYPKIAEMILTGDMHMLEGLKVAAKVGVFGKPYIGLYPRLSKRLSGRTDINVSLKISDEDFALALNDIMGSGRFGTVVGSRFAFGKLLMRVDAQFPSGGSTNRNPLNANEKNSGYRAIQYDLIKGGMGYHLKISIQGTGTKESNSKLNQLHNLIDDLRRQVM
jgi:hypothetical protein